MGWGNIARTLHGPCLTEMDEFELLAACDPDPAQRADAVESYGCAVYEKMDAFLQHPGLELVIIPAPNHLHGLLAIQALEAPKHVIVEKPMCLSTREADRMIELASRNRVVLTTHQNRRWDADFLAVKEILEAGTRHWKVENSPTRGPERGPLCPGAWPSSSWPREPTWRIMVMGSLSARSLARRSCRQDRRHGPILSPSAGGQPDDLRREHLLQRGDAEPSAGSGSGEPGQGCRARSEKKEPVGCAPRSRAGIAAVLPSPALCIVASMLMLVESERVPESCQPE